MVLSVHGLIVNFCLNTGKLLSGAGIRNLTFARTRDVHTVPFLLDCDAGFASLEVSALAAAMGDCNDLLTGVGEETWMQLQPLEAIASIVIVNDGHGKVNRPIERASCPS